MPEATTITQADYVDAMQNDLGWCTHCEDFTREMCEPDAREYRCPVCEQRTVYGAEWAMVAGMLTFGAEVGS